VRISIHSDVRNRVVGWRADSLDAFPVGWRRWNPRSKKSEAPSILFSGDEDGQRGALPPACRLLRSFWSEDTATRQEPMGSCLVHNTYREEGALWFGEASTRQGEFRR